MRKTTRSDEEVDIGNGLDKVLPTLTWSIVALGICVVIIAGVGLYLGIYRRRKLAAEKAREDMEEADTEED